MEDNKTKSYYRTLIFTVVASLFSMALFGLLFWKRELLTFVVIVEAGVFAIIVYLIYVIVQHERMLNAMSDPRNFKFGFDVCPDYYVKRTDGETNKDFCSNEYVVADKDSPLQKKLIMKIVDENSALPSAHSPSFKSKDSTTGIMLNPKPTDKFLLDDFFAPELKTNKERCDVVNPSVVTQLEKMQGYKNIPWTYTRPRCDGIYGRFDK
jgi:hypothetical protein